MLGGSYFSNFTVITSLAKKVMFLVVLVCLSVCLWTQLLKNYKWIGMKFYGGVLGSTTMKNWLNFGGDLGIIG